MRYALTATGTTYWGDTSFVTPETTYRPEETFRIRDGVLSVLPPVRPEQTRTPDAVTINGPNLADIALYFGSIELGAILAGELRWASNVAMHPLNRDLSGQNDGAFFFHDEVAQTYAPGAQLLVSTLDARVADNTPHDAFLWRSSLFASTKTIVDGEVTLDFAPDFRSVEGALTFLGQGAGGAYAVTARFAGPLIAGAERPALAREGLPTSGPDRFVGGPEVDEMAGRGGRDTLIGRGGADALDGGGGADLLRGGRGADTLTGGKGGDLLKAGPGRDVLRGDKGADALKGGKGPDALRGGRGPDELKGGKGPDTLRGGRGPDELRGGGGDDALRGGKGRDTLKGGGADDRLNGGGKPDRLKGGGGDDTLRGGRGDDVFVFRRGDGDDVIEDFEDGADLLRFGKGIRDADDLEISAAGDGTEIVYPGGSVLVRDTAPAALDAEDLIA